MNENSCLFGPYNEHMHVVLHVLCMYTVTLINTQCIQFGLQYSLELQSVSILLLHIIKQPIY